MRMTRLDKGLQGPRVIAVGKFGVCVAMGAAAAILSLAAGGASAQPSPPSPPPGAGIRPPSEAPIGTPAGPGTTISSDPKLLAPLPPPSAEVLRRDPPSPNPRDLGGVWASKPQAFPTGAMRELPLTETGKQRVAELARRQHLANEQGKTLLTDSGRCRPMEGIGIGSELFPAQIIQNSEKIVVLNEEGRGRWIIHMNGKPPAEMEPSHFGYSTGRWEGDTLVVETVGLRRSNGAFGRGLRGDKAHIISRLHKTNGGQDLELSSTLVDPETYTQPVDGEKTLSTWHPELTLLEFQCEENPEGAREGMIE